MIYLENRRVRFEYEILDTFTAGLQLQGWEVKSLRARQGSIRSAWVSFREGELYISKMSVVAYKKSQEIMELERPRKLLLKKRELEKIERLIGEKGRTIAVSKIFPKGKVIKAEISVVRGKKLHEKRQVLKNRDNERSARRMMKNFNG